MTIIEPKKNKGRYSFAWTMTIGLVLFEALLSIYSYSQNVRLTHELFSTTKAIESLRISTADFKNQLYAKLDLKNADKIADKLGLIKEKKPEYLSVNR